jgi:hypothetical protein
MHPATGGWLVHTHGGLFRSVVSEDVISPDLVRQIYRYAQDPFGVPHPPSSDAALLPLLQN